jgi:hypothetical protein
MDRFMRWQRSFLPLAFAVIAASPGAGCGKAEVTGPPGTSGGGVGGPGPGRPGGPGGVPTFVLPDAGAAAAPPPTTVPPDRQCAEEAHQAQTVPLDLLLLVDASGSMTESAGQRTKWETAQAALGAFIRDQRSAGLGVGLQFFPAAKPCKADADCGSGFVTCQARNVCAGAGAAVPPLGCGIPSPIVVIGGGAGGRCPAGNSCVPAGVCATSGDDCTNVGQACPGGGGNCTASTRYCSDPFGFGACDLTTHAKPAVPIGPLPMAERALVRELNAYAPTGGTPMGPAVRGALAHLRAHLQANPGRKAVLVLASDGLPSAACEMNDIPSVVANVGAAFTGAPSIPTYVIGVFATNEIAMSQVQLDRVAMAGGSSKAIVLAANDDLTMRLTEALNQIRGAALACEYQIPPASGGRIDFGRVNVRYTGPAGPAENIPYVERADRCDPMRGGWYYDVAPATGVPTRVQVCEATCSRFKSDQGGKVDLVFGCGTQIIN